MFDQFAGTNSVRPDSTAAIAGSASGLISHEPLRRQQRLDDRVAALAVSDVVLQRFGSTSKP